MTDDEIREALRLDFEQTADWRRSKAADTQRTVETWRRLPCSTNWPNRFETVAPDLLNAYGSLRDDYVELRSSTAKCSGRSVSTGRPKQPRSLLRRASPTGQRERKVRERRGRPARASNVPELAGRRQSQKRKSFDDGLALVLTLIEGLGLRQIDARILHE